MSSYLTVLILVPCLFADPNLVHPTRAPTKVSFPNPQGLPLLAQSRRVLFLSIVGTDVGMLGQFISFYIQVCVLCKPIALMDKP